MAFLLFIILLAGISEAAFVLARIGGDHQRVLRIYQPLANTVFLNNQGDALIKAAQQLVDQNKDANGLPTFAVEIIHVAWADITDYPLCVEDKCADIIILGTTQIPRRISRGELESLNPFFSQYATETGEQFSDNFIQKYIYDYFVDNQWIGIPLVTDTRMMYFNRKTLDLLNLTYPPPHGDWGPNPSNTWTWKTFVEYTKKIKRIYFEGFSFRGAGEEELFWLTTASKSYNAPLFTTNRTCGYRSKEFQAFLNEVAVPLFHGTSAPVGAFADLPSGWISEPLEDPINRTYIKGLASSFTSPKGFFWSGNLD